MHFGLKKRSKKEIAHWNSHKDLFKGRKFFHQDHAFFLAEDYMRAKGYYEKSVTIIKAKNYTKLAICCGELGGVYSILDEFQKAMEMLTKSLEISLSVYGEQHSATATSYNNLG